MRKVILSIVTLLVMALGVGMVAPQIKAAPARRSIFCDNHLVVSGSQARATSNCSGMPVGQKQKAAIRHAVGINQYVWSYGSCVGNGVTSYTLFYPNYDLYGSQLC